MSVPHPALPPPLAMTLAPQQHPTAGTSLFVHHTPPLPPPPPSLTQSHQQRDSWTQLPAPPQQWQTEESMRNWLQAKAEEEKRRQEEERTRQESLRLEQRKVEIDMLRTSLSGGIPPVMVPLVFVGMGSRGTLPQAVLEWASQSIPPSQASHPQLLRPQPVSLEHQADLQAHAQYLIPPAPPHAGYAYPGSPTKPRGQMAAGAMGRPVGTALNLPRLNTNIPQPTHAGAPAMSSHPHVHQTQSAQQEFQSSPSIYFHHWQPPGSQANSSSNRPGTPSSSSNTKGKRTSP